MYLYRFVFFVFFVFAMGRLWAQAPVLEDVVYLKNGSVVRGKILEYKPAENIRIEILGGSVLVYPAGEVVEIRKEESKVQPQPQPQPQPTRERDDRPKHTFEKGWSHFTVGKLGGGVSTWNTPILVAGFYHSSGYHFSRAFSVGLGLGMERNGAFNMIPVGVDLRGYMMKTSTSMYYSFATGYAAVLPSAGSSWLWGEIKSSSGGYYAHPALGVRFGSRNRVHTVLDFGIAAYGIFNIKQMVWDWETGMEQERITNMPLMLRPTLRVGIVF